jgi:hypothetical protein
MGRDSRRLHTVCTPRASLTRAVIEHAVWVASQPQGEPPSIQLGKLALFDGGALHVSAWHCLSSAIVAICDFSVAKKPFSVTRTSSSMCAVRTKSPIPVIVFSAAHVGLASAALGVRSDKTKVQPVGTGVHRKPLGRVNPNPTNQKAAQGRAARREEYQRHLGA